MQREASQDQASAGRVQTSAELLAENLAQLAAALSSGEVCYDEAIERGYVPLHDLAEEMGVTTETARKRMMRRGCETILSRVPGKRLAEKFWKLAETENQGGK